MRRTRNSPRRSGSSQTTQMSSSVLATHWHKPGSSTPRSLGIVKAIRLKPANAQATHTWVTAFMQKGKLNEAITELREAIRRNSDQVWAHINLGRALQQQGKVDDAIAAYREAIRRKPDYAETHYIPRCPPATAVEVGGG